MQFRFDGQVVLITGASTGIGKAIALAFGKCGARVAVNYRENAKDAARVVDEIRGMGQTARAIRADVSEKRAVTDLLETVVDHFGRVDILVNNAGSLIQLAEFGEISEELWDRSLAVNLKSVFLCSQAVVPLMERQGGGNIVNISSGSVHTGGGPGATHYTVAKAGVCTLTRAMARELIEKNIRVNGVNPGIVATPLQDKFRTAAMREAFRARIPLKREALPEEIAAAVLFLASKYASYVVGEMVEVNGGMIMV